MGWHLPPLGAVLSLLAMMLLAIKWNLPRLSASLGAAAASLAAAVAFLRVYPLLQTRAALAVAVVAQVGLALSLALAVVLVRFWRDPERVPPEEDGVVLSASDGKVVYVRAVHEGSVPLVTKRGRDYLLRELTGTSVLSSAACIIGVDMSLMDVHVTRCPIAGQVKLQKHTEGKFVSLRKEEAPFVNERVTTLIENAALNVTVVQVASRLVRCVESYRNVGETVNIGQRLGMIRVGSLVAVVLPLREDVTIEVKPGDRVTAGVSIVARYAVNSVQGAR